MRQLLTWCATRAMEAQPASIPPNPPPDYEDQSARLAGEQTPNYSITNQSHSRIARVIQEELLKDLANRSEMSDWFNREDDQKPEELLPLRPNPKNIQNGTKIAELELKIKR